MTDEQLAELLTLTQSVDEVGTIRYRNSEAELHRLHGPAVIYTDGSQRWYYNGVRHRSDGPAMTWPDGSKSWYQNGLLHRTDGPAIESPSWSILVPEWKRAVVIMNARGQSPR